MDEDKIIEAMARAMSGFDKSGPRWMDIASAAWDAAKVALAEAGYAIVPIATAEQIAEFETERREIKRYIAEREKSIQMGARRSSARFKL